MSITIAPIRPEERPRCQYCGKPMHPRSPEQRQFKTEEEFAAFSTNRRVYAVRRRWTYQHGNHYVTTGELAKEPKLYCVEVSFFPDDKTGWGSDGLFCSGEHAKYFAYSALKAGYRMKLKGGGQ